MQTGMQGSPRDSKHLPNLGSDSTTNDFDMEDKARLSSSCRDGLEGSTVNPQASAAKLKTTLVREQSRDI